MFLKWKKWWIKYRQNSGNNVADHFAGVGKMVDIGSESKREIYMLSDCYEW